MGGGGEVGWRVEIKLGKLGGGWEVEGSGG